MNMHTIDLVFCLICLSVFTIGTIALYMYGKHSPIVSSSKQIGTSDKGLIDSIDYLNKHLN